MINRYCIYEQYEYWGKDGKTFTRWFRAPLTRFHKTEDTAKEEMKKLKDNSSSVDKYTKLKHKYEVRLVDIETFPIPTIHYGKKGRPSKAEKERREEEHKNYWKIHADDY